MGAYLIGGHLFKGGGRLFNNFTSSMGAYLRGALVRGIIESSLNCEKSCYCSSIIIQAGRI